MTSAKSHLNSEELANAAHSALRSGEVERACRLFADAARAETAAFDTVPENKPRTLGILAVSAAALWFKAGEFRTAEQFAQRASSIDSLPAFARRELSELLQAMQLTPQASDIAAAQRGN